MGGSSGAVQSSTQTSEPWAELKQPMLDTIANAKTLYSQPYQSYGGQTVADPADSTLAGFNLGYQRATLGAPDLNAARGSAADIAGGAFFGTGPTGTNQFLGATAAGQNLNSNPWLSNNYTNAVIGQNAQNMANSFATGQQAINDSLAARAGAYGGSAHLQKSTADAGALANQVGQMANQYQLQRTGMGVQDYQNAQNTALNAANMQQGAYQSDVGNILNAGNLIGNLSQDDWKAADYLRSMGAQQEGYQQKLLDSAQNQWNNAMNAPYQQMNAYKDILAQFGGMGSTGNTQMYGGGTSPLGLGVGAGLLGLGAYNAFK